MVKIAIVGISGSGKTTLAGKVAAKLRIPHVEIDAAFHLEGWEPNPNFLVDLAARLDTADWVCDGNYRPAEELVRGSADVIVCFDLPRHLVMRQVIARTIRRAATREVLWNGNREPRTNFYKWNPEENIIRWTWVYHGHRRQKMLESERTGAWDHADVVWLRSHAEADAWLDSLPSPPIS